jgi:beta-glucanase (GH16 family)
MRSGLPLLLLLLVSCSHQVPPPPDPYHIVWSDEFNTDGPLNPHDWNFEDGFQRNNELQWYQPDNATCKHGLLIIEARREHRPNPTHFASSRDWRNSRPSIDYTSSSITTAGKHEFQYGRFECRCRIDPRLGSWPAFWTVGVNGPWPANGEIDIMEYYTDTLLANIAWAGEHSTGDAGSTWNSATVPLSSFGDNWATQFHVWRMDWDESSIKLYCDDKLLNSQDLSATTNRPSSSAPQNPFHQPHYLWLDQAIGGRRGGDPSNTTFPVRFEIDYVRVYQKQPPGK